MGAVRHVFEEWKGGQCPEHRGKEEPRCEMKLLWKVGAKLWGLWVFNILVLILQGKKTLQCFKCGQIFNHPEKKLEGVKREWGRNKHLLERDVIIGEATKY